MLKALELVGFKSFADKTRFDFPSGITVVVGPNGSGKSNIVDAIKWVLGEQRARSLRGKEMADVIFKGSGSGTRKPANTAEATIIFDNSENLLQIDAPEVHVTRRVYRSGEGEYLINGAACRLRDVKDLFRGTGVGTDAYSLIEQGKVDNLLQASPRDRRAIFEEAAGISRFKAKKIEAQRRLERVEQNLLRLSDIVEEVDSRLRRLKSQASKARRFKEHSDRLQELRTQVGRVDWQRLTAQLESAEHDIADCAAEIDRGNTALEAAEAKVLQLETSLASAEDELRLRESRAGRNRERLAALVSTVAHQQAHLLDLEDELGRFRQHLLAMTCRAGDLQSQLRATEAEFASVEHEHQTKLAVLRRHQDAIDERSQALQEAKARTALQRAEFVELMQQAAVLGSQISADESALQAAHASRTKFDAQQQRLAAALTAAREEAAALSATAEQLTQQLESSGRQVETLRQSHQELTAQLAQRQEILSESNERRAAIGERAKLIEEIEARMEGVGSGVKEVLRRAREDAAGPFAGVRGMVADLLEVTRRDLAEMVAVALGNYAEHVVVAGAQLIELLARGQVDLPGRVGLLRLQSTPPPRSDRPVNLEGQSGVIGRADQFVQTAPEYHHLVQWVLADTWFVETLSDALQFRRSLTAPVRFVTRAGELLDRDGRLLVGPSEVAVGLIARRAELRELKSQLMTLDSEIGRQRDALTSLRTTALDAEQELETQQRAHQALNGACAEARLRSAASQERVTQIQKQYDAAEAEHAAAVQHARDTDTRLAQGRQALDQTQAKVAELESVLMAADDEIQELETELHVQQHELTAAKVVATRSEQRVSALRVQQAQLQRDQNERTKALADARLQTRRCEQRRHENEAAVLQATAEIAELSVQDEAHAARLAALSVDCEQLKASRGERLEALAELRQRLRVVEQQKHSRDLEAERIRHERQAVAERLHEDYGISIVELRQQPSEEERAEREQVDLEIAELRRKLTHLGSVNMDALEELGELEARHGSLASQYQDLVDAKQSLERIIHKINSDSRRLFSETLEHIRANFQVLFRKVFGGGRADIVLEEGVDILDAGIDIVATPPGKNSLGLSLLSGGERALTAVTLLLAIFEYRPSPFCVLDEVDGPLDEANIGRFLDVLFEFLNWTKFVVVTHSKKTMTAAHTLYGVTMQESGVSKRVSVRFEDVNEQGEISAAALHRTQEIAQASNDDERGAA